MSCPVLSALSTLDDVQQNLFIGCSGGRDSMSLAFGCYLLHQQGKLAKLPTLIHINHGIQKAGDAWANFVATWAKKHGFFCQIISLNLGKTNETNARQARYHAIASLMQHHDVLLTAHHQDDQAETVLMRLINGAGVQGLSGMRTWQSLQINHKNINIHRPLLNVSRMQITMFAHAHHLHYIDDPTNDATDNVRNFIRHDILPRLATLNPKTHHNIANVATLMAETHALIHETTFEHFKKCHLPTPHAPFISQLDVAALITLSTACQSVVVRHWLQADETLPPNRQITNDIIALSHRTDANHRTQIFWQLGKHGHAFVICRYQNTLYRYHHQLFLLLNTPTNHQPITPKDNQIILKQNKQFSLVWHRQDVPLPYLDGQMYIKSIDKTCVRVSVFYQDKQGQTRQGFDTLSSKKLYQKLKIPTWQRQNLWGIYVDDELVLMMGVDTYWLTDSTLFGHLSATLGNTTTNRSLLRIYHTNALHK